MIRKGGADSFDPLETTLTAAPRSRKVETVATDTKTKIRLISDSNGTNVQNGINGYSRIPETV
jgi:hypothetical protein